MDAIQKRIQGEDDISDERWNRKPNRAGVGFLAGQTVRNGFNAAKVMVSQEEDG